MLKNIPSILTPELLKILMEMGHGDEIVIADGNFPAVTCGQRVIRADGHGVPELLDSILMFLPLDHYVKSPVILMEVVKGDKVKTPIWNEFKDIVSKYDNSITSFEYIDRYNFYERAKKAFAVIATGESALYANIILKKGVIVE
jgi:L-fucose mutarotase